MNGGGGALSKKIPPHRHKASDIVETQDDYLLPYLRSLRDPTKIDRAIVEGSEITSGTTFPAEPFDGELFFHTGLNMMFRWNATADKWVSIDYGLDAETSITVNAAGTSITITDNATGLTVTLDTTGLTIIQNDTGVTIQSGSTSVTVNEGTTGVTVDSGTTGATAGAKLLDLDLHNTYTGTVTVGSPGGTEEEACCTLPISREVVINCRIGLHVDSPDVEEECFFYFYFYSGGTLVSMIGGPMKYWLEKGAGKYPWAGEFSGTTDTHSNSVEIYVKNKKSSGSLKVQWWVRVYKRAAHTHTISGTSHDHPITEPNPGHPHGLTDPSHGHTPTDPEHLHTPSEGSGHDHPTNDPEHPHTPNDPTHPHGTTDPTHGHDREVSE